MQTGAKNTSLEDALTELAKISPTAPFLALGQTIFWDEPMKVGVAVASKNLGFERRFVAGVHDTDYFAKVPGAKNNRGGFITLPHNDTQTRGFWSAAGEFSALFGSETVVTRDALQAAGLRTQALQQYDPGFLDKATEAWGWRGIASLDEHAPITADVKVQSIFPELKSAFDWALNLSLQSIGGKGRAEAEIVADQLRTLLCDKADETETVSDLYESLLPSFYSLPIGQESPVETARTSRLLQFNSETCNLPRFEILNLFLNPETQASAVDAYNASIERSGLYGTKRFGTGAIPFDLVIPGLGRGTIRIGTRGVVIQTAKPQFLTISAKEPLKDVCDLARLVEKKFGPNCAVVGKAVTLIGMLSREFVFVFHEGASSYVKFSRDLHRRLARLGYPLDLNPILRIRYDVWGALSGSCSWLRLPEPLQQPFGSEEVCAHSFSGRWKQVSNEQSDLLLKLGNLRRPVELIRFLEDNYGGSWSTLATDYEKLNAGLKGLREQIEGMRASRQEMLHRLKALKARRALTERAKGDHFRAVIFEQTPTDADIARRNAFIAEVDRLKHEIAHLENDLHHSIRDQREIVSAAEIMEQHASRRRIELEAELKRLRLIRNAVTTSKGLASANLRPSAWWYPLVCPKGEWFRKTWETAECYLEPLK